MLALVVFRNCCAFRVARAYCVCVFLFLSCSDGGRQLLVRGEREGRRGEARRRRDVDGENDAFARIKNAVQTLKHTY